MTDEELKKKCTERAKIFQQAMESCHSSSPIDCIEWLADRIAELEKEKQIQIDTEHILTLQNEKGELTDKIKELEAQIEKMKCLLNEIYSEYGFSELVKIRNALPLEIEEVIKEIKEND